MTDVYLVRHGPTHAKTMVGWSDLPADLSDTAALARLAAYLPDDALVVSSDLIRATATADAIQSGRHRLPHDPRLREIHFGDWELKGFAEIEAKDPDHIRAYWEDPGDVRPPNGESWHDVAARVNASIDALLAEHTVPLIVTCHFGVILTQVQRAENLTNYQTFSHKIDNLAVTHITYGADIPTLNQINHRP